MRCLRGLWPTLARPTLATTFNLAKLGARPILANGPRGPPSAGPPSARRPKFRAFFPLSPPIVMFFCLSEIFSCLFSSLVVFSWNFGGVLVGRNPQMCLFSPSGCPVKPRRPAEARAKRRDELVAGSSVRAARRTHDGRLASRHGVGPSDVGRCEAFGGNHLSAAIFCGQHGHVKTSSRMTHQDGVAQSACELCDPKTPQTIARIVQHRCGVQGVRVGEASNPGLQRRLILRLVEGREVVQRIDPKPNRCNSSGQ